MVNNNLTSGCRVTLLHSSSLHVCMCLYIQALPSSTDHNFVTLRRKPYVGSVKHSVMPSNVVRCEQPPVVPACWCFRGALDSVAGQINTRSCCLMTKLMWQVQLAYGLVNKSKNFTLACCRRYRMFMHHGHLSCCLHTSALKQQIPIYACTCKAT